MSVRARKYRHRVVGSHRDPSPYLAAAFLGLSLSPLLLPSLLLFAIKTHGTSATNAACTVPVLLTLPHRRSPILLHRHANPRLRRCIVLLLLVLSPRTPIRIAAAGVLRRDEPALLHRASAAPPRRGPAAPPGAPAPRILAAAPQPAVVVWVLHNWVNYGKGWRSRWFVLEDGVLSYYKLRGGGAGEASATAKASPAAARVVGEGDALRRAREVAAAAGKQWKPFGEIHLKVRW
jgi:hypothetical protein